MCKGLLGVLLGVIPRRELGEQNQAEGEGELQRIELIRHMIPWEALGMALQSCVIVGQ